MKNLTLIVAMDENNLIGKENGLPWSLPEDLKYFKKQTSHKTVLMGYNTYLSIGRPLPNRRNLVLTRKEIQIEGCEVVNTLEELLQICENEEVMVMGGKQVYELLMPYVNKVLLTRIENTFVGDTIFDINLSDFEEIDSVKGLKDEKNNEDYYYLTYLRK